MAYWLGLPAPPVAIPDCATCGRQLSALTDVTSTGDWHNLCFNCRLGGANERSNTTPDHRDTPSPKYMQGTSASARRQMPAVRSRAPVASGPSRTPESRASGIRTGISSLAPNRNQPATHPPPDPSQGPTQGAIMSMPPRIRRRNSGRNTPTRQQPTPLRPATPTQLMPPPDVAYGPILEGQRVPSPIVFSGPSTPVSRGRGGATSQASSRTSSGSRPALVPKAPTSNPLNPGPSSLVPATPTPTGRRVSEGIQRTGTSRPGEYQRQAQARQQNLARSGPSMDFSSPTFMEEPAVTNEDWTMRINFYRQLDELQMESCELCNERWFDMDLDDKQHCKSCRRDAGEPLMFSKSNNADPEEMPVHLPRLSAVEELLIARTQVAVEIRHFRTKAHNYRGHICHLLNNSGKVYHQLPLLPHELDMLLLKPTTDCTAPAFQRQFGDDFQCRRDSIEAWLTFLIKNHAGYRDVQIDQDALAQLPQDASVELLLPVELYDADGLDGALDEEWSRPIVSAVPDLVPDYQKIDWIRQVLFPNAPRSKAALTMSKTMLSEFNKTQPLLSLMFPALFPCGKAEYLQARLRSVDYPEFVRHLLKYKDGRFFRHHRFRFVAFNTIMRRSINTRSSFFVRRVQPSDVSLDDLRRAFEDDSPDGQIIINSITRFSGALRGTRPFWDGKRRKCEAMAHQLGSPHLFITLTAAETHWYDLMRHMPQFEEWKAAPLERKSGIARRAVGDNPAIAAYWFHRRSSIFQEVVIKPKFNVSDSFVRTEMTSGGSPHLHGLFWCNGAPSPEISKADGNAIKAFCAFWGMHISAQSPDPSMMGNAQQAQRRLTTSVPWKAIQNSHHYLAEALRLLQRHGCSKSYCLRPSAAGDHVTCRFGAPWSLADVPRIAKAAAGGSREAFHPARNHPTLNAYNALLILAWLAHIDIQVVTGRGGLYLYLTKYVAVANVYTDILVKLMPFINPDLVYESFVSSVMHKLFGDRQWPDQEICYLLLNLPLTTSSRTVVNVDCRPEEVHSQLLFTDETSDASTSIRVGRSPLEKYKQRKDEYESLTYLDFLLHYDTRTSTLRRLKHAKERVLNFFPRYNPVTEVEDFARVKLMLHHRFRAIQDLMVVEGTTHNTFAAAWEDFRSIYPLEADTYGEEEIQDEDISVAADVDQVWNELTNTLPEQMDMRQVPTSALLGTREVDKNADWTAHVGKYPGLTRSWWDAQKVAHLMEDSTSTGTWFPTTRNMKQELLHDVVAKHYRAVLAGQTPLQMLLQLDGQAGSGKTTVIRDVYQTLAAMAQDAQRPLPIVRSAPTGVASCAIDGVTLHSLFRFSISKAYVPLKSSTLKKVKEHLKDVSYLIIDEKSMVGLKMLTWIHERCRDIWPETARLPFSGRNIIISGDFYQLPPTGQLALYNSEPPPESPEEVNGRRLYLLFDQTITLDRILRQQGDDHVSVAFRRALSNLRVGEPTHEDWNLLSTRMRASLTYSEQQEFDDVVRILARREDVHKVNHSHLRGLNQPVLLALASHEPMHNQAVRSASTQEAGNLQQLFAFSIGCKVMLTENIWVPCSLVNGSIGTVEGVVWEKGAVPLTDPPLAILVHFPKYNGPALSETPDGRKMVPIFRTRREWTRGEAICARIQFPLVLAYAITIHKSQSTTLDRAVLNITNKRDFTMGLTYVAVSRVRTLQGILFEEPFDFQRLCSVKGSLWRMREMDRITREGQQIESSDPGFEPRTFDLPHRPSSPSTGLPETYGQIQTSDDFGSEFQIQHLPPNLRGDEEGDVN